MHQEREAVNCTKPSLGDARFLVPLPLVFRRVMYGKVGRMVYGVAAARGLLPWADDFLRHRPSEIVLLPPLVNTMQIAVTMSETTARYEIW
jgi:hypothetical protein